MAPKIKFRKYRTHEPPVEYSSMPYGDVSPQPGFGPPMIEGHGPPHPPTIEPVTQEVSDIANNISKEIAKQTDLRVAAVLEDGGKDEWIAWFQGEVEHWKQRAEELEIELECMRNAFPEHDNDISPKIRGIY